MSFRFMPAAAGLALALILAGCGSGATPASKPAAKIVARTALGCTKHTRPAGLIKYSDWQFPDTLNPFQTTEAVSFETINGLFESLFVYNSQGHVIPQMATAVPTSANGGVKNGGKTIVVNLKRGLHWSDGSAITSQDVAFGWRVGMDPLTGPWCTGSCDIISKVDASDPYKVIFHLKRVYSGSIAVWQPPVWPHSWKRLWNNNPHAAAKQLAQNSRFNFANPSYPTSGPYQVVSWVKDDRITLQPMRYYSGMNCGGAVKSLIFAFYANKQAMIAAAANGGTDLTQDYTANDLKSLHGSASGHYTVSSIPGFIFEHFELNVDQTYNGKPNPLANVKVRQAMALALDKIGMIRSALGLPAAQAKQIVAWTPWVNTPQLVQPYADKAINGQWDPIAGKYVIPGTPQAVKDAKTLLAQTPYRSGFNTSISTTTGNPVRTAEVEVAAKNWRALGINVTPNYIPATTFFAGWDQQGTLDHGKFQIGLFTFSGSPEPDSFKYELESKYIDRSQSTHAAINENYSGIRNPAIDHAFTLAAGTFNSAQRKKEYAFIQKTLNQQAYWIGLYFRPQIATVNSNVGNFSNNPTSSGPTWNMYAWKSLHAS